MKTPPSDMSSDQSPREPIMPGIETTRRLVEVWMMERERTAVAKMIAERLTWPS